MTTQPWERGDQQERWNGYLDFAHVDPEMETPVLRNLVGATTYRELREREDDHVAVRALQLRERGIPHSYGLDGLREVHRHLFQDVYPWAGEVRTVEMGKAGERFYSPQLAEAALGSIEELAHVSDAFRDWPTERVADALARSYALVNEAHVFREGNGRSQRAFLSALAAESGHEIDWEAITGPVNDYLSIEALRGNPQPMRDVFQEIVHRTEARDAEPAPELPPGLQASYPRSPSEATRGAGERSPERTRQGTRDAGRAQEERER